MSDESYRMAKEARADLAGRAGVPGASTVERLISAAAYRDEHQQRGGPHRTTGSGGHAPASSAVASLMTTEVVTARVSTTARELQALMTGYGISGVPVVDNAYRPVGVVSEADLAAAGDHRRGWHRRDRDGGLTARDLMTTPVVTIGEDQSVTAAIRLLVRKGVRRLYVVDPRGVLVGVVSRRDVLGALLRSASIDDMVRSGP
ncbi:CBS domain-containing protein [Actinophytocola xinjiangensis]|nr:CBS domain-containing protein [Actinophytocola xinjiangensis]